MCHFPYDPAKNKPFQWIRSFKWVRATLPQVCASVKRKREQRQMERQRQRERQWIGWIWLPHRSSPSNHPTTDIRAVNITQNKQTWGCVVIFKASVKSLWHSNPMLWLPCGLVANCKRRIRLSLNSPEAVAQLTTVRWWNTEGICLPVWFVSLPTTSVLVRNLLFCPAGCGKPPDHGCEMGGHARHSMNRHERSVTYVLEKDPLLSEFWLRWRRRSRVAYRPG